MLQLSFVFLATLLVLSGGACEFGQRHKKVARVKNHQDTAVIEAYVTTAETRTLFTPVKFAGLVRAKDETPLFAPLAGIVRKLHAQEGTRVAKGSTVLSLIPINYGLDYNPHLQKASAAGTLVAWNIKEGDYVAQGDNLGLVADMSAFETTVQATYADLPSLSVGTEVDVKIAPASSWETLTSGKIVAVVQKVDPAFLTFPVRIAITCPKGSPCSRVLRLGALAEVQVSIDKRQALVVPSLYLHRRASKVISVDAEGKCRWLDIQTGQVVDEWTEVTKGIDATTQILTSFSRRPKEGESVQIVDKSRS